MNCPNCGKELKDNQKFCTNCGYNIKIYNKKYIVERLKKIIPASFLIIFLLILLISGGINFSNEHKIKQALNNSSYDGNKILIKANYKFNQNQRLIFDNDLKSKYAKSVYIAISARNKAVIYSSKDIKPEDIISYLTRPVINFKKQNTKGQWIDTGLNDKCIEKAHVGTAPQTGEWIVEIEFKNEDKEKFAQLTKELTGKELAIFYNDKLQSTPRVNEQITDGHVQITGGEGGFEYHEAKEIVNILNADKNLQIIEVR